MISRDDLENVADTKLIHGWAGIRDAINELKRDIKEMQASRKDLEVNEQIYAAEIAARNLLKEKASK